MDREAIRSRVHELLVDGSSYKMLRHGTDDARRMLEDARRLAEGVGPPWTSVVAYRLGNVLMRNAANVETLRRAEALFAEAARGNLGPWPHLYRLAALHRLGASRADRMEAWRRAWEECRLVDPYHPETRPRDPRSARLQAPLFNALEMAAWFVGAPYEFLDGQSQLMASFHDLFPDLSPWRLVSVDPRTATISYPREMALAELDARGRRFEGLMFVVERDAEGETVERWRRPGQEWQAAPKGQALLLAAILLHGLSGREGYARLGGAERGVRARHGLSRWIV